MAAVKLIVFLCLAALGTSAQTQQGNLANPELRDIIANLLALLHKLQEIVTKTIQAAIKDVTALLEKINAAARQIVAGLAKSLGKIVANLIPQITDLVKKATAAGINATACVGSSIADITALPKQFLKNTTTCLDGKMDGAKEAVNQTIEDIKNTAHLVLEFGEKIVNCSRQSILVTPVCFAEVSAEIASAIVSLPIKIAGDVAKITAYIVGLVPKLAECEVGVVGELAVAGGAIVANVTECINRSFHPPTPSDVTVTEGTTYIM